jgi:predicted phage-related endonuclease
MRREVEIIGDRNKWLESRRRNVGASDVAALFHSHKYRTALELWGEQVGKIPYRDGDSAAMRRGRILEPAVLAALGEAHPEWEISQGHEYITIPELRLGCTPDARVRFALGQHGLIQAKTTLPDIFEAEWTPSPPAAYLFQVQTEMLITQVSRCVLAVMVLDGREFPVHEYTFDADPEFAEQIVSRVRAFWRHVEERREPALKLAQDGSTLFRMHPEHEEEPVLQMHGRDDITRLCQAYADAQAEIKRLEGIKDQAACLLMAELRNHKTMEAMDWRVNWTTVPATTVVQNRKAHRRLSVRRIKGNG